MAGLSIRLTTGLYDPLERTLSDTFAEGVLNLLAQQNAAVLLVRPDIPDVYESGVRYAREPAGKEHWIGLPAAAGQRELDCEDLAAWRAGELIAAGEKARVIIQQSGPDINHVVVQRADGAIEDPSELLMLARSKR